MNIRPIELKDHDAVWEMLREVMEAGDTNALPPDLTREEALAFWMPPQASVYVAEIDGTDLGTYYIKPNQLGPGGHVCNAGYIVSSQARGQGGATAMCEHSQQEARRRGFRAMQFNLVVSTNVTAVRLWYKLGFQIVGTIPRAFDHPTLGLVDAYVMYKWLE